MQVMPKRSSPQIDAVNNQTVVTAHGAREKLTGSTAASWMPLHSEPHLRAFE